MSTHNIDFYEEIAKLSFNYHQISSNTHLISSSDLSSFELHYKKTCFLHLQKQRHRSVCTVNVQLISAFNFAT